MPRKPRSIQGGHVYHVLNRASGRAAIFLKAEDYAAFERTLEQAIARIPMRILSYVLMPNHFHLVLWPRRGQGKDVSEFMRWLQVTHTQRWHAHYESAGEGHLYQGRFKSFPVQGDMHVRAVCRYVERNPVRAKLCKVAEDWQWSSLHRRVHGSAEGQKLLSAWPEGTASSLGRWVEFVNTAQKAEELAALRLSLQRGSPFGSPVWIASTAKSQSLEHTLRSRGRPRKSVAAKE